MKKNFWLDLLTFALLIVIISSSIIFEKKDLIIWGLPRYIWVFIHAGAGLAIMACLVLHLVWHWNWIKTALSPGRPGQVKFRRNLSVNVGLLIFSTLIAWSGLLIWPRSGNLQEGDPLSNDSVSSVTYHHWHKIHLFCACFMLVLVIWHLAIHWRWIVSTARRCLWSKREREIPGYLK